VNLAVIQPTQMSLKTEFLHFSSGFISSYIGN